MSSDLIDHHEQSIIIPESKTEENRTFHLTHKRFGMVLVFALAVFVVLLYFYSDAIVSLLIVMYENCAYFLGFIAGFVIYAIIYLTFRHQVVLRESDPENGIYGSCKITKTRFQRMAKENGPFTPRSSYRGYEVYHIHRADFKNNVLFGQRSIFPDENVDVLMTIESSLLENIERRSELEIEVAKYKVLKKPNGLEYGIELAEKVSDVIIPLVESGGDSS